MIDFSLITLGGLPTFWLKAAFDLNALNVGGEWGQQCIPLDFSVAVS